MLFNIWIDDMRQPPHKDNLVVFRNAESAIEWFESEAEIIPNDCFCLYLDHDLGEYLMNGYDLTKEIINLIQEGKISVKKMIFHTANPTGHKNMVKYVENANKRLDLGIMVDSNFYGF